MEKTALIFGGTGFIGLHFASFLVKQGHFTHVVLADIKPPSAHVANKYVTDELASGRIRYIECDVRRKIAADIAAGLPPVDFIANFAAVHREPGHQPWEYFATNLPGAENVCSYAEDVNCNTILFTSSISPYGPTEEVKTEASLPAPETAYGSSKLVAEYIHKAWRDRDSNHRRLLVVRPGVVFGPGEGGNVSRLVKVLAKGFFVYAGNRDTRKAGIYVRELCHAMWWMQQRQASRTPCAEVVNMSMNPGPSMREYVEAVQKVVGKQAFVPSIPVRILLLAAVFIEKACRLLGIKTQINLVRVRKIVRSNNILPALLASEGYSYKYSLESALADWRSEMPEEWAR